MRRLLSERIAVVPTQSSDRRSCDGSDDAAASPHDRRHDGSQPLASNRTILRLRGRQVQSFLRLFAGSAGDRGGSRLPASLGRAWLVVVTHQPGSSAFHFFSARRWTDPRPSTASSAPRNRELPVVLSRGRSCTSRAVPGPRNRAALTTAYGRGCGSARWPFSRLATSTAAAWSSGSSTARGQGPVRHALAPTPGHPSGLLAIEEAGSLVSPALRGIGRSAPRRCRRPARWPRARRIWGSPSRFTRCATASPRTCSKPAPISAYHPVLLGHAAGDDGDLTACHQCHHRHFQPSRSLASLGDAPA